MPSSPAGPERPWFADDAFWTDYAPLLFGGDLIQRRAGFFAAVEAQNGAAPAPEADAPVA